MATKHNSTRRRGFFVIQNSEPCQVIVSRVLRAAAPGGGPPPAHCRTARFSVLTQMLRSARSAIIPQPSQNCYLHMFDSGPASPSLLDVSDEPHMPGKPHISGIAESTNMVEKPWFSSTLSIIHYPSLSPNKKLRPHWGFACLVMRT